MAQYIVKYMDNFGFTFTFTGSHDQTY